MLRRTQGKVLLTCLLVLALVIAGCGQSGDKTPDGQAGTGGSDGSGGSQEPIKIGMLVEQTGAFSWYGEENLNGAKLAAAEINEQGGINGRPIELVVYNSESSPEKAIAGANKLIQQDKVVAIVGLGLISEALAVAPIVADEGPPVFALSGAYQPNNKFMFGGTVYVEQTQERAVQFLVEQGLKRIAVIVTNDATGQQAEPALKRHAEKHGAEIVTVQTFNPADVDVTPQLTQIKALNPDAIISWTVGKPLGVVLNGTKQLEISVPFVTSHGNVTPDFLASLADLQTGPIYVFGTKDLVWRELPDGDPQKDIITRMQSAHQAAYGGKEGGIGTGTGYDAIHQLAWAIGEAGTNPDDIVQALEGMKDFVGVVGIYNMSADDHRGLTTEAAVPIELKDGKLQMIR